MTCRRKFRRVRGAQTAVTIPCPGIVEQIRNGRGVVIGGRCPICGKQYPADQIPEVTR